MPHKFTTTEKLCPKCKTIKSVTAFGKNKGTPDGLQNYCKACRNDMASEIRKTPEFTRYRQEYETRPHVIASRKAVDRSRYYSTEKRRAYVVRHRDRQRARDVVRYAVRTARLPKVSNLQCGCAFERGKFIGRKGRCNAPAAHYHHYLDYSEANHLSVEALCTACHGIAHQKYKAIELTTAASRA